jgi:L-galactose dehydrogenase
MTENRPVCDCFACNVGVVDVVRLGRTELAVGVAGLGCGGRSRLGQSQGASVDDSIGVVREALDLGVTYIDTARSYGTEEIVGRALKGRREGVVVSTKVNPHPAESPRLDAAGLRRALEESLVRLDVENVDVFHLHGVVSADYAYCMDELAPELLALRDLGQIRFFGLSEQFAVDLEHDMLRRALRDDYWDVVMVGFNMLNPSARASVFPQTIESDVGVEIMFAVRNAFSHPDVLRRLVADAVAEGLLDAGALDLDDPFGFLVHESGASSIPDAAYRFARHEPGAHVVLTGTGDLDHLRTNIHSINAPPLSMDDVKRLVALFGHLAHAAGN